MKRIKTSVIIALFFIVIIAVFVYIFTDISLSSTLIGLALIVAIMYFSGLLRLEKTYDPKDRELVKRVKKIAAQSQTTQEFKDNLNKIDCSKELLYVKIYMQGRRVKGEVMFLRDIGDLVIEL